jgi:hypothetical protein
VLPQWGPDGRLYFISDAPDGWWNLKTLGEDGQVSLFVCGGGGGRGGGWLDWRCC